MEKKFRPLRISTTLGSVVENIAATGRVRKQAISIVADSFIVAIALWAAFSIRLNTPFTDVGAIAHLFLLMMVITVAIFVSLGIYRWMVRASNNRLYVQLAKGSLLSSFVLLTILYLIPPDVPNPRSLFVIYGLALVTGTSSSRLLWGSLFDAGRKGIPIAIYGAGSAGVQLANSLAGAAEYRPVCFIDDERDLRNTTVCGLPVLHAGSVELQDELRRREVNQVVIAIPSLGSDDYERLIERLESLDLPCKTMPGFAELVSGQASFDDIRDISISDVLGRSEVPPDPLLMRQSVEGLSVMVTGGAGSIGSELCRQIIRLGPKRLIVVDNCEAGLYAISEEIESSMEQEPSLRSVEFVPVLCSVQDVVRIPHLLAIHSVSVVFHAAAYKHVPIMEDFPGQAVDVNVFGTRNMLDASISAGVSSFVLVSTDKAVRPANAMGASKRVAELILQARSVEQNETIISMVRFGNVLASSGSVVPKFKKQIEAGGPVTLTHKEITRYFMTIPEAAQLVVQASAIAKPGSVFVLDMGKPVKILHLAQTMIRMHQRKQRMSGQVSPLIRIKTTGLRSGEKLHEELFEGEDCCPTPVAKIMQAREPFLPPDLLESRLTRLEQISVTGSAEEVRKCLFDTIVIESGAELNGLSSIRQVKPELERKPALSLG